MNLIYRLLKNAGPSLAAVALAAGLLNAAPARAEWLKAESERFIVYSDGREPQLRRFVQELESFDRLLRLRLGLKVDEAPYRKLPIYLVGSHGGLTKVSPDAHENLAGFYTATDEDIFGVAIRDRDADTLKHEYAHHFMWQNFAATYPGWFVEGFAEYFSTVEFERDRVAVGKYNENRAYWLQNGSWLPMRDLLSGRPQLSDDRHSETYYPLAWLLTHWFMSDPARQRTLSAYLADVGGGGDPVEAMQRATGLTPEALQQTLRRYMNARMTYVELLTTFDTVEMTVTPLPRSADDLLLLNQRLKMPTAERAVLAEDARRAAARHPDDPLALLVLGHAELHFGDETKAEAPFTRLLEQQPDHVEALQYMALIRMGAADQLDDYDAALRMREEAQQFLARAYRADNLNYVTLLLIAENRAGAPGYPNDNDVAVLEQAFTLAPQWGAARVNLAQVLMYRDRNSEAIRLLEPLVNDPHDPSSVARDLLQRARDAEAQGTVQASEDSETQAEVATTAADD